MVDDLEKQGIVPVEDTSALRNSVVIIRSHGITQEDRKLLVENGNTLIDATCPFVSIAQEYVSLLSREEYPLLILGDMSHPEVIAMLSYCNGETYVVSRAEDLPADKSWNKLGVISQTTMNMNVLQEVVSRLVPRVKELKFFNTICTATSIRQEATTALAQKCDLMIIVGGHNSSNTKMLAALCSGITKTLHIETADELNLQQISSYIRIGLTAGASTPDYLIVDVYKKIKELTGDRTSVKSVEEIPVNKEESC